ncbi:MAG: LPS assembly lipoprotein LptE [Porticoccaceae bacterium]|nr:LPS assembly lipoprotein LptE [Porticoccaceae bacterium]
MSKKWVLINLTWVFLTLNACGWQLRNTQLLGNSLGTVHVSYSGYQSSLAVELKHALRANDVQLVGATDNADYQVKIIDTNQSRRISALNASARAAQYQIYQTVDYMVLDPLGAQIIPMTTVSAESTYNFNESDVLASQNEEALLQNNLRSKIVRKIIRRLGEASDSHKVYP